MDVLFQSLLLGVINLQRLRLHLCPPADGKQKENTFIDDAFKSRVLFRPFFRRRVCLRSFLFFAKFFYFVSQPPIAFPPAGILPFLDLESIKDTGFRLARFSREDCTFMGPAGVLAKVPHERGINITSSKCDCRMRMALYRSNSTLLSC